MNLPELLGTGNPLVANAPKATEPSVPQETDRQSFMDTLNDTSGNVETADRQKNQAKSDDNSESSDEAQILSGSVDTQTAKPANTDDKRIEAVPTESVKNTGFSAAYAVLETQLSTTKASESGPDQAGARMNSTAPDLIGRLSPTITLTTGIKSQEENQPKATAESPEQTPSGKSGSTSVAKVDALSMQKPLSDAVQSSTNAQVKTNVLSASTSQAAPKSSAMQVDVHVSDAPVATKMQSIDPKVNKKIDSRADVDAAKSDLKTMEIKLAKEALHDQRQSERRGESASYELKSLERAINQVQNSSNIATSTSRFGLGQTLANDIAQPSTTNQSMLHTAQTEGPRDLSSSRALTQTAGQAFESQGAARSAASQIAAALKNQPLMKTIELSLDPPELGRIEIHMEVAEMGLRATLSAERSGTGDLIRRQAELLLQQLDNAGFSDVNLDFRDFGGEEQREQQNDGQNASGPSGLKADVTGTSPQTKSVRHMSISGMDVRL